MISIEERALLKKYLILQQFCYHFAVLHLFPRVLCHFRNFLYLRKNGLTVFKNNLLSLKKEEFSLLKIFLRSF